MPTEHSGASTDVHARMIRASVISHSPPHSHAVCVPACVRACVRACARACVGACVRARVHACARACVGACMRGCVRACVMDALDGTYFGHVGSLRQQLEDRLDHSRVLGIPHLVHGRRRHVTQLSVPISERQRCTCADLCAAVSTDGARASSSALQCALSLRRRRRLLQHKYPNSLP